MRFALIQMDMAFACPDENFKKAETLVRRAARGKPDVIVLPETWNVGFYPKDGLADLSDPGAGRTKAVFSALARELGVSVVAGSVAAGEADGVHNRSLTFDAGGNEINRYDKTHLFTPMHEDDYFVKGGAVPAFSLNGRPAGVLICYDLRFPELARTLTVNGIDYLIYVSQWPDVRVGQLHALLRARAIENQCFVLCCNSCGKAPGTVFGGQSAVFDPLGNELAAAGTGEEILFADCDESVIEGIRASINVFRDRRPSLYDVGR